MPIQNKAGTTARIFNERRGAARSRAPKEALIRFDHGQATIESIVRNLSARGARLSMDAATAVPRQFQLRLDTDREWRNVTVRWRRGNEIGVSFDR